jgi:1-deoxyxylulose-5-phosphate synthase
MKCTRLGSSGLKVSRIGLGMMSYADTPSRAWMLAEDAPHPILGHS